MANVSLKALHVSSVVDDQLEEELVDWLEMRPGRVENNLFFLNPGFVRSRLFHYWEWSKDVLLDHLHYSLKIWDDQIDHIVLVSEQVTKLRDILESLVLLSDHFVVVIEVEVLATEFNLLDKNLLAF
jgi:hypothetical protein